MTSYGNYDFLWMQRHLLWLSKLTYDTSYSYINDSIMVVMTL